MLNSHRDERTLVKCYLLVTHLWVTENVVGVLPFILAGGAQVDVCTLGAFIALSYDLSFAGVTFDANVWDGCQTINGCIRSNMRGANSGGIKGGMIGGT